MEHVDSDSSDSADQFLYRKYCTMKGYYDSDLSSDSADSEGYSPVAGLKMEFSHRKDDALESLSSDPGGYSPFAALPPELIDRDRLVLRSKEFDSGKTQHDRKEYHKLQKLIRSKRSFYHLKVQGCEYFDWMTAEFWFERGHEIKSLILEECFVENPTDHWLRRCPKLKCLTLYRCVNVSREEDVNYNPKALAGLENLIIIGNKYSDFNFKEFLMSAPNLKSMDLKYILYPNENESKRILAYLVDYFQSNPQVVLKLSVSMRFENERGNLTSFEEDLVKLSLLPNLQLRILDTYYFPRSIYECQQPWLCDLQLDDIGLTLTNDVLECIRCNFPNLKTLSLAEFRTSPATIFRLPRTLTCLNLSLHLGDGEEADDDISVTEAQLLSGLCSEVNTTLKELSLSSGNHFISSTFFVQFAKTHPLVTRLRIHSPKLDDQSVQAILKYQALVQELNIGFNHCITDACLTGEAVEGSIQNENLTGYSICGLKDLQKLTLAGCSKICGQVFEKGVKLPKIKTVLLGHSKVTLKALECLVENNPTIEELGVELLTIPESFVYFAVEKLPQLHSMWFDSISKSVRDFLNSKKIRCYDFEKYDRHPLILCY